MRKRNHFHFLPVQKKNFKNGSTRYKGYVKNECAKNWI